MDTFKKCPEWARAGHCTRYPQEMMFHCRESCGTCGFKSAHFANKIQKTTNDKEQYTNIKGFNDKKFKLSDEFAKNCIKKY